MSTKLHVSGSPEKLVEAVIEEAKKELSAKIDEAYTAAKTLLDDNYREAIEEVERAIRNEAADLEERLKALEASKEVELRMLESRIRSKYTEEVIREALRRASSVVPREKYRAFLAAKLREALESMKKYTSEARVIPCEADRQVLAGLASEVVVTGIRYTISPQGIEDCSGFILESGDGKVRLDYRLETLLAPYMDELRAIALRNLFPS